MALEILFNRSLNLTVTLFSAEKRFLIEEIMFFVSFTKIHDYIRHGTTTLFAALDYLSGKIISRLESRHRHIEWLRFLKQIDRETQKELNIHLIMDNFCTHKHSEIKKRLERHPRFHVYFTPAGSSWMNLVERFFADITADVIREGSFNNLKNLEKRNENPKPYVWKADGKKILKKLTKLVNP